MAVGPIEFLNAFAQALSALALYPEGHTSRERALDVVYQRLVDLQKTDRLPLFSFLGDEVVYGDMPIRELRGWDWSRRLSDAGVQRLQFETDVSRDEFEDFLDELLARLTLRAIDTSEARQMRPSRIRFGAIGIKGEDQAKTEAIETATIAFSLADEADTVRWMHDEVSTGHDLPLSEAEAVVRGLSVAMHGDQKLIMPLLKLRRFDEYTTTHSINVSVLTMGLAEWLGMGSADIRAFGVSGLLHDLGKVKIPLEVLTKPGKLTDQERAIMNAHPAEGARLILSTEHDLELAAVVAYEHHIMLNGGGYPKLKYQRDCHWASRMVHVCDVYDALRTKRPYRDAWAAEKVLSYLEERSGTEFDGEVSHSFVAMMREWEPRLASVTETEAVVPTGSAAPAAAAPAPG
jgi:putative nucleotidyltransferase with HDIG domain